MKMVYKDYSDILNISEGDVKILKTTEKSVFVKCWGMRFRLKHGEIVKDAKIIRLGSRYGHSYYVVITVKEE